MAGTLYIADPSLRDRRGHHFQLALAVTRGALALGRRVVWLGHVEAPADLFLTDAGAPDVLPAAVEVRPVFRLSMYDAFRPTAARATVPRRGALSRLRDRLVESSHPVARGLVRFYRWLGLSRAPQEPPEAASEQSPEAAFSDDLCVGLADASPADIVLLPTADAITFRAMLRLATRHSEFLETAPGIHLCTPYDTAVMPHGRAGLSVDRTVFYLERLGLLGKRLFLYAENALLAEELATRWNVAVAPLDLPPPVASDEPDRRDGEPWLTVSYLGAAREEKGFCWLPQIVETVLDDPRGLAIRFFVQCSPQVLGYTAATRVALDRLQALKSDRLVLHDAPLGAAEYAARLRASDVVLMPYDPARYRVRGSGIAVEAVATGCIILSTPDTFPAHVAGEAACTADSAEALARELLAIGGARESWRQRAGERARWYRAQYSAVRYVERLMEAALQPPALRAVEPPAQAGQPVGGVRPTKAYRRLVKPAITI